METTVNQVKQQDKKWWVPVLVAFLIVQILFFIDEGYYDFRWMKSFGNWFVFMLYWLFLTAGQLLVKVLFFRKRTGFNFVTISLGVLAGLGLAFYIFSHH